MVSSIYDPLGLVSPFLLEGRRIIQMLCHNQSAWDDPVDEGIQEKWAKWKCNLNILKDIRLSRCYKPEGFGQVVSSSLHHFSDASENGYGQVVYVRLVNAIGKIHCSLVIAKSRVAPIKYTSIPRLELAAAVLSTKMSAIIRKELQYEDLVEYYWTDSQVVLGYLRNTHKRFKVFVANRVQQIREHTDVSQWNYVPSKMNPADCASRGLTGSNKKHLHLWFNGPEFLWKSEFQWPRQNPVKEIQDDDPEVKREMKVHTISIKEGILERLESLISDWMRMKRVVAWILKYKKILSSRVRQSSVKILLKIGLDVSLLEEAQQEIIRLHQQQAFKEEVETLMHSGNGDRKKLMKRSSVYKPDPFIDETGLLKVGRRLRKSNSHFTELMFTQYYLAKIVTSLD